MTKLGLICVALLEWQEKDGFMSRGKTNWSRCNYHYLTYITESKKLFLSDKTFNVWYPEFVLAWRIYLQTFLQIDRACTVGISIFECKVWKSLVPRT